MTPSLVELQSFSFRYAGARQPVLRGISLQIRAGECHCLTGATGSGKTTLALALKGLLPSGVRSGRVQVPVEGRARRAGVGLVMQNPETQLFAGNIGEEVAFGLENLGFPAAEMEPRVRAALRSVGLDRPLSTPVAPLSMGEKYRLLLAATLVLQPQVLILDEPAAQLDAAGLKDLHDILAALKVDGIAVLICEHRPQPLHDLIDYFWRLDEAGQLQAGQQDRASAVDFAPSDVTVSALPIVPAITANDLVVRGGAEREIWSNASFRIWPGERILVQGANGAGKSTLLHLLAGLQKPLNGELAVLGRKPSLGGLRGRLGCLLQNPQKQLFEDTVAAEVGFALQRKGVGRQEQKWKVDATLDACGLRNLAGASPHKLSFGQKHLVALAAVLAVGPELVLLDDPFAGLDHPSQQRAWSLLLEQNLQQGTTLVWTSHHVGATHPRPHAVLKVEGGSIVRQYA